MKSFLGEGAHFPSFHSRCCHSDPVDPSGRVGNIAADVLKTLSPEKLTSTGNIVFTFEAVFRGVITAILGKRSAGYANLGIFREFLHQEFQVIRRKREIAV